MKIIRSIRSLRQEVAKIKLEKKSLGFVPTMGAMHEGHISLIRQARKENDSVVVSIFVNPAQFAPREDFKKYPRNLKRDAALCRRAEVDILFCPDAKEMYPAGYKTYITVEGLSDVLCGKFRPGHFKGVATIVAKLFNIVQPDIAYFGQKDGQQAVIIKQLARDLNIPVEIKIMPTVREKDGLAMSSRNFYLNEQERRRAPVLFHSLKLARLLIRQGQRDTAQIIRRMRGLIQKKKNARIDYVAIVDREALKPLKKISGRCLIALAVWIGKTRLIDNVVCRGL